MRLLIRILTAFLLGLLILANFVAIYWKNDTNHKIQVTKHTIQ